MTDKVLVYDPTADDLMSKVRGVGRYLQILRENFPNWKYINSTSLNQLRGAGNETIFLNPFFNFLQKPLILDRIAKKQVAVIHDLIPLKYPNHFPTGIRGKVHIFLNKMTLKNYDQIVTDSEASKRDIIDILNIGEEKIKVIYPCLTKVFTEKKNISRLTLNLPASFCLYVGDATWNKNLVNLAAAIKEINVSCVFVGKIFEETKLPNYLHPWQQEFRDFLEEVNGDKRFIFLGFVPDEKLLQLYRQANCNILVSRDEGFGFSYLEAASQSCPSILSDIPILKEISNGGGALLTNLQDINAIANAIGEVYFNQVLRNELGAEAEKRSKFFSQKKFKDNFSKFLII
ncbi:hypothetical protein A2774_05755 [Candidatus Roizmanbacteria bacterium RIFCSPHIGHO2_01_FULL_39_12c]|uniref:Glycosyl transferase family 1 domain-containing protein n=1 Tax=Candidatus Roizmanbacteria bacterium RIFCSPHIGHO2_01_FULL_39_12c TaxID=1802031 RepID=A0A1F7G8C7_9BACT|nr:MAG: hypothetical protein A2774_05755 [Candidatus Roizmanbacteria bacterium RIFCSPHIGHO2_01_FULL_39_12c]OGK47706.1 MAG: hypothetical protein A2963_00415 [Candidatus Roizmanbacteria bacterium RIFCSPLOWO2_01_FULL_40_13]